MFLFDLFRKTTPYEEEKRMWEAENDFEEEFEEDDTLEKVIICELLEDD